MNASEHTREDNESNLGRDVGDSLTISTVRSIYSVKSNTPVSLATLLPFFLLFIHVRFHLQQRDSKATVRAILRVLLTLPWQRHG